MENESGGWEWKMGVKRRGETCLTRPLQCIHITDEKGEHVHAEPHHDSLRLPATRAKLGSYSREVNHVRNHYTIIG